jgi:hypothetical protein
VRQGVRRKPGALFLHEPERLQEPERQRQRISFQVGFPISKREPDPIGKPEWFLEPVLKP